MADPSRSSSREPTLYLASGNPGKRREFGQAALSLGWTVEQVPKFKTLPPCSEDGDSFDANARKKALHYSRFFPEGLVFADDSGLCVYALGGAPGVFSARYAGPKAADSDNNRKLLNELARVDSSDRRASYFCVIALARQGEVLGTFKGSVEGRVLEAPRGTGGFGYDPLVLYEPLNRTFAELSAEAKFSVSHRGQAFSKLLDFLISLS